VLNVYRKKQTKSVESALGFLIYFKAIKIRTKPQSYFENLFITCFDPEKILYFS